VARRSASSHQYVVRRVALPPTPVGVTARIAIAIARWLYARTFRLSPIGWALGCLICVAGLAAALVLPFGEPVWSVALAACAALLAMISLAALVTWLWTARRSKRLVVFLTPFDERSADATRVAPLHVEALRQELCNDPLLRDVLDVRTLKGPLRPKDATRLILWAKAHAVIGGNVTTVAGAARWSPWLLVRWRFGESYAGLRKIVPFRRRLGPPNLDNLLTDPSVPIEIFAEEELRLAHAEIVHAAVLLLAATDDPDTRRTTERLAAAATAREALPVKLRALLIIGEHESGEPGPLDKWHETARRIAEAGDREADDPYLWAEVNTLFLYAERFGASRPSERLPYQRRLAEAMPDKPEHQWGLGMCLLAVGYERWEAGGSIDDLRHFAEQALPPLRRAVELPRGRVPKREIRAGLRQAEQCVRPDPPPSGD
jgi:hypothetical protein